VRLEWDGKCEPGEPAGAGLELLRPGRSSSTLIQGENLFAMRALGESIGPCFALIYLDPPFFTGRVHTELRARVRPGGRLVRPLAPAFDDRWEGLESYLSALAQRIRAARELLAENGCLVLHVDPKTSHYAKVLCDEIFGRECFASEIVWRYRRWPSKTRNFQRIHDVLLRYVRDARTPPRFRQLYEPLAASTLATWGDRKQRAVVRGGRRLRSSVTVEPTPGAPLGDVWEIGIVAPVARERTGYPTQKPEALLERLVQSCTEPGDWVLDPYMGSGTTLAVCARLGRGAVGIDSSERALTISRKRLRADGVRPREERVLLRARASKGDRRVA
jgi:site-specific DNA-methyltransferase (adenine-specific)